MCKDETMTPPPTDIEDAEYAGQLLFRLWRASHTRTAAAFETIGLTPALFAVLNFLRGRDGVIQQEIGSAMGIDRSTMVTLIDELEREGLAKRRPRPEDRRAREVSLTPKGMRTLERARELAEEEENAVLQGISASDRRELKRLLRQALRAAPSQPPWSAAEGD